MNPFLLYYPLKQGLKLQKLVGLATGGIVFTLLSIKTRIETPMLRRMKLSKICFYSTIH